MTSQNKGDHDSAQAVERKIVAQRSLQPERGNTTAVEVSAHNLKRVSIHKSVYGSVASRRVTGYEASWRSRFLSLGGAEPEGYKFQSIAEETAVEELTALGWSELAFEFELSKGDNSHDNRLQKIRIKIKLSA